MLLTISVLSLSYTESDLIFGKSNPKAHVKYRNFAITYLTLKLPLVSRIMIWTLLTLTLTLVKIW